MLTAIRVPTEAEEAVRDLARARAALLADRKSGSYRTRAREQWIAAQRSSEPALGAALAHP